MNSVYLAARYSRRPEIKEKSLILKELGIYVTSRWLYETPSPSTTMKEVGDKFCRMVAKQDIEDIREADEFVLFSENPEEPFVRGGRHFETGFAYAIGKPINIIGPRENVFHYLNYIKLFSTWEDFLKSKKG